MERGASEGVAGAVEGLEMCAETCGLAITGWVPELEFERVWRRKDDGSEAKLFLLCCQERFREDCACSPPFVTEPSLFIAWKEEEFDSGGVG